MDKIMNYFTTTPPLKIAGHVGFVALVVVLILWAAGVFSSGKEYFEVFMSTPDEEVVETKMPDEDEKKRLEEEEKKKQVDEYLKSVAEYEQKYKAEIEKAKAEKEAAEKLEPFSHFA
jgi:hypothetical protein